MIYMFIHICIVTLWEITNRYLYLFFYVIDTTEVESTGRHGQFYEKFNIRYHIAVILKELWPVQEHQMRMIEQSKYVLIV